MLLQIKDFANVVQTNSRVVLMLSKKITAVRERLLKMEKEQRSDQGVHTVTQGTVSHLLMEAWQSRKGHIGTTWIFGFLLNYINSTVSLKVWQLGKGQSHTRGLLQGTFNKQTQ